MGRRALSPVGPCGVPSYRLTRFSATSLHSRNATVGSTTRAATSLTLGGRFFRGTGLSGVAMRRYGPPSGVESNANTPRSATCFHVSGSPTGSCRLQLARVHAGSNRIRGDRCIEGVDVFQEGIRSIASTCRAEESYKSFDIDGQPVVLRSPDVIVRRHFGTWSDLNVAFDGNAPRP